STGDKPAVIPPVETNPREILRQLVLQMRGLVELLVVVDTKHAGSALTGRCNANSAHLRLKETCSYAGHYKQRGETVKFRNGGANGVARNFGVVPFHGEENRGVSEDAEVVAVVGVLPEVFGIHNEVFSEGLLEADVKFVAPGRL